MLMLGIIILSGSLDSGRSFFMLILISTKSGVIIVLSFFVSDPNLFLDFGRPIEVIEP